MIRRVVVVFNNDVEIPQELKEFMEHIKVQYKLAIEMIDYRVLTNSVDEYALILLYLDDAKIKTFLKNHLNTTLKIAFIPNKDSARTLRSYGISKDIYVALDEAMNEDNLSRVDILTCNGEIVFTDVVIGDVHGLSYENIENQNIFTKIKKFYLNLKHLGFKEYTLTTANEKTVQTAATGVMILEHNSKTGKYSMINEDISLHDGHMNAFIISPTSIFAYLYYLLVVSFYTKLSPSTLPKTLGFIKTSKLDLTSTKPLDFVLDGALLSAQEINLEILKDAVTLSLGKDVIQNTQTNEKSQEETELIKVQYLPKGDVKNLLLTESVPLFKKAQEEDFKELFLALKESAKPSSIYIVLMLLSTLLATTGLFQSSAPVIIGAMILAPLMSPIISLSMGVVRADTSFITTSLKTLAIGIVTAIIFSSLYTYFMPLHILTDEMRGRLNPNILDLMVAVISGVAGAYASAKSEVAKSLAGVAIAVALIPPLSVAGIGLGWGDFDVSYGAFLLFSTNLVGITLAASVTFLVLGYAPINRAKKGIIYTSAVLFLVTIPLVIAFDKAITQSDITSKLNNYIFTQNEKTITIRILNVDLSKKETEIFLQTNSDDVLNKKDLTLLKEEIQKLLQQKVTLNISTNTIIK